MNGQIEKRVINVTRTVIEKEGRILAAQRSGSMSLPLKWEFPGGKMKEGETPEECIVREIKEELDLEINIVKTLPRHIYYHGSREIRMVSFICRISQGEAKCIEHKDIKWGEPKEMKGLDWANGDTLIYQDYMTHLKEGGE